MPGIVQSRNKGLKIDNIEMRLLAGRANNFMKLLLNET